MRTRGVVAVSLILFTAASCKDSVPSAAGGEHSAAAGEGRAAANGGAQPYAIDISAPSPVVGGRAATARVTVRPVAPYKINLEYPFKMTVTTPPNATMGKSSFAAADAREFSKQRIRLEPAFTLDEAGVHRFVGEIRFSVCTEALCELKRAKVSWTAQTR